MLFPEAPSAPNREREFLEQATERRRCRTEAMESEMKALIALAAATIIAAAASSPALAREGCGPGFHRAWNGMCRASPGTYARYVEGHFYPGHGYWYRNQWYQHRRRRNGVWIYIYTLG